MSNTRPSFDNHKTPGHHENALLRLLVDEAIRRGDTLQSLAENLGVTYSRFTQWRRHEADIKNAHRNVLNQAALYLRQPVVVVMTLAGVLALADFVLSNKVSAEHKFARALESMQQDPLVAGMVPSELASSPPALRDFVALLYLELLQQQHKRWRAPLGLSLFENAMKRSEDVLEGLHRGKKQPD